MKTTGDNNPGWFFAYRGDAGGGLDVVLRDQSGKWIANRPTNLSVGDNAWHHLGFTYDGSRTAAGIKIYLDGSLIVGVLENQNPSGSMATSDSLQLGYWALSSPADARVYNGVIDELSVYSRARSSDEIVAIYAAGSL